MDIILILLLICAVIYIVINLLKTKKAEKSDEDETPMKNYPYEKQFLLTKNEWSFYKKLKPIAIKNNWHILAKVRLADISTVKKGLSRKEYSAAFSRIKSKHIDFVLANPDNLALICAIELDDSSHGQAGAEKNDSFKNALFEKIGLPLIRLKNDNSDIESIICGEIAPPTIIENE